jgi:uncharacterized protein YbaR (Trm112 family)
MMPNDLLERLACPRRRAKVSLDDAATAVLCRQCGVQFPVRGQAPILLLSQATPIRGRS